MIEFDAAIFKKWQTDFEEFNLSFRRYCFLQFRAYELRADFVPNVMQQIHSQWVAECDRWLDDETHPDTTKLSYLKRAALLLHNLVSIQFLGNMVDHEYDEDPKVYFRGTDEQRRSGRLDIIDAREAMISLDFVLLIIHYFESNRNDRVEAFKMPLTIDMRHDLISYLLSGTVDNKALYLILKALYLRHSSGGKAN